MTFTALRFVNPRSMQSCYHELVQTSRRPFPADTRVVEVDTEEAISVTLLGTKPVVVVGKVSLDFVGLHWWVSQAHVQRVRERGRGYGSWLLQRALELASHHPTPKVLVMPGGYGMDRAQQVRFYERNGFVKAHEGWVWVPSEPAEK